MNQGASLDDKKKALTAEFKKPKSLSQCITELKEIKKLENESVWELDQRFKMLMGQMIFNIPEEHHKEWFIAALLPHIRLPLT